MWYGRGIRRPIWHAPHRLSVHHGICQRRHHLLSCAAALLSGILYGKPRFRGSGRPRRGLCIGQGTLAAAARLAALAALVSILGICMCWLFHKAEHWTKEHITNNWLRIAIGGILVALITFAVGDMRYNGAGMDMALGAVAGKADLHDFALKLLLTAITLAAGFKGGEIVPTFCIGATFGCVFGGLLGLEPGIAGALGLVGLFCCATNAPIASIVLSLEMFGSANLHAFALVCVICFVLSGKSGLYTSQIQPFR